MTNLAKKQPDRWQYNAATGTYSSAPLYPETLIYRGLKHEVWRVYDESGQTFIVKHLRPGMQNQANHLELHREFTLSAQLPTVSLRPVLGFGDLNGLSSLICEDVDATTLREWCQTKPTLPSLLRMFTKIARGLASLHVQGLIHLDISPLNILITPSNDVLFIDLGGSERLGSHQSSLAFKQLPRGLFSYLAPEQTGRIATGCDERTDLYSLGVCLYEAIVGHLPFAAREPLELVHAILTKQAYSIQTHNPDLPDCLNFLVQKLLNKNPNERYRGAMGVAHDLEQIAGLIENKAKSELLNFVIATNDSPLRLHLDHQLYGRQKSINAFLKVWQQVQTGNSAFLIISGQAGSGKTSLVRHAMQEIWPGLAWSAQGKFEQLRGDRPYDAIIETANALLHYMQAETREVFDAWVLTLKRSLGENIAILGSLIPILSDIFKLEQTRHAIAYLDAKNQIQNSFIKFFESFIRESRSIVLFFDDLQWADHDSLELIEKMTLTHSGMLIIGSFRNDDSNSHDVLKLMLGRSERTLACFEWIKLENLETDAVNRMLCDAFQWDFSQAGLLVEIIYPKTHGNPFFIKQILQRLYQDGSLFFSLDRSRWCIDDEKTRTADYADNVINLLKYRLHEFPETTRLVLGCAAYLGYEFSDEVIIAVTGLSEIDVKNSLATAVRADLVLEIGAQKNHAAKRFRFVHDRVTEACQSLFDDEHTLPLRLKIGRILIGNHRSLQEQNQAIVATISDGLLHCHAARMLIDSPDDAAELANLCYEVAQRALAAAAWGIAARFFRCGTDLLPDPGTESRRQLSRQLLSGEGVCAMLRSDFSLARDRFDYLLSSAKNSLEFAQVQHDQCELYTIMEQYEQAIQVGVSGLRALGIRIGTTNNFLSAILGFFKTLSIQRKLSAYQIDDLTSLPKLSNPRHLLIAKLFRKTLHPATIAKTYFALLLSTKQMSFTLKNGLSSHAAVIFSDFAISLSAIGAIVGIRLWNRKVIYLLIAAYEKLRSQHQEIHKIDQHEVSHLVFLHLWTPSYRETTSKKWNIAERLLISGDPTFTQYTIKDAYTCELISGSNFLRILSILESWDEFSNKHSTPLYRTCIASLRTILHNFTRSDRETISKLLDILDPDQPGPAPDFGYANSDQEFIKKLLQQRKPELEALKKNYQYRRPLYLFLAIAAVINGDYQRGLHYGLKTIRNKFLLIDLVGMGSVFLHFLLAICLISLYGSAKKNHRLIYAVCLHLIRWRLTVFADISSAFVANKVLATEAFIDLTKIKTWQHGLVKLQEAIRLSHSESLSLDEAILAEVMANLLQAKQLDSLALEPLRHARDVYERCGATSKVKDIMLRLSSSASQTTSQIIEPVNSNTSELNLDAPALMRAASAISKAIELDRLKRELLQVLVEIAGARHAVILWRQKDSHSFNIVAYRTVDEEIHLSNLELDDNVVASRILQASSRQKTALIIRDVMSDPVWRNDESLRLRRAKSALCLPVERGGEKIGYVYLEHDLMVDAFTSSQSRMLDVLASQIAISLDNAFLYEQLRHALAEERASHTAYLAAEQVRRRLQVGIEAAEAVQKSLISICPLPSQCEVAHLYIPAENTGGDWLSTFYAEDRHQVFLCLGDVTGHGMEAALTTAAVAAAAAIALKSCEKHQYDVTSSVHAIASAMNTAAGASGSNNRLLMTMAIVGIDLQTGLCHYLNAGQTPLIHVGQTARLLMVRGNVLGFEKDPQFNTKTFTLLPGERLFLYSDGLVENRVAEGRRTRVTDFYQLLETTPSPHQVIAALEASVRTLQHTHERDDTCCLHFLWHGTKDS